MAVPTTLTNLDSGAPALSGSDGALYNVLKWALPQIGWTLEFDDDVNFRAAFKNDPSGGLGGYLRVIDKAADHASDARQAQVWLYDTMTDVNSGTNPTTETSFITKSENVNTASREWRIVGDKTSFWLETSIVDPPQDDRWHLHEFGSLHPRRADDNTFHMLTSSSTPTITNPWYRKGSTTGTASDPSIKFLFNTEGTSHNQNGVPLVSASVISPASTASMLNIGKQGQLVDPVTGKEAFTRSWVSSSGNQVRGWVRGMWWPIGDWASAYGSISNFSLETPVGIRSLQLHWYSGRTNTNDSGGSILLDRTGDWDD